MQTERLQKAVKTVQQGGIIAYPTEAVYGLGCDPDNETATMRLLTLKQRPIDKGLIIIAATPQQLTAYINPESFKLHPDILTRWPGPYTWLIPCLPTTPCWLTGSHTTLAVRITAHPLVIALCHMLGKPLISTSANPSGAEPAKTAETVQNLFPNTLDYILPGATGGATHISTIRDAKTGDIIR